MRVLGLVGFLGAYRLRINPKMIKKVGACKKSLKINQKSITSFYYIFNKKNIKTPKSIKNHSKIDPKLSEIDPTSTPNRPKIIPRSLLRASWDPLGGGSGKKIDVFTIWGAQKATPNRQKTTPTSMYLFTCFLHLFVHNFRAKKTKKTNKNPSPN